MGNITKIIAEDYSKGIIEFTCNNIDDIRKIGSIIDAIAFQMQHKNIDEFKGFKMNEIYKDMTYYLSQLSSCASRLKACYKDDELPNHIDFLVTHINENIVPGLNGFISQAQMLEMLLKSEQSEECNHRDIAITSLEISCKECNQKLGV